MAEQPPPPDRTSGSDVREARELTAPLEVFRLEEEARRLTSEREWSGDRNAVTLAKEGDLRLTLVALKRGAVLDQVEAHGRLSAHVLRGSVTVRRGQEQAQVSAGEVAAVDSGHPWSIEANDESAVLLTFAYPREDSLV